MGEHSAVYGRPALVAAVDRRLWVTLEGARGFGVRLELPQVAVYEELEWDEVLDYADGCRAAWERYRDDGDPALFRAVRGEDPAHLVKVALGEVARFLDDDEPLPLVLRLESEIPIGSGFGSSAAAAVAVLGAYLALRAAEPELAELEALALEVERRQHGRPSGVDGATVLHGGLLWAERDAAGTLETRPLAERPPWLGEVRVYQSGMPAEATGAVVAAVARRRDADPAAFDAVLDRMEAATRGLRGELAGPGGEAVVALLREQERCLEALGVVPEPVRRVVRQVEARGGGAKISGAGALSGDGAGSLLVYHPREDEVESWGFLHGLDRLDLRLGAEGLRREDG